MEYAPVITNRPYDGRILAGDEILVQLEKEAVRSKEPVFTTNLSLAGKYSVVSCGNTYKGVSRKCSKAEKEQLRAAIPEEIDYGVVIRTNAALLLPALETTDDMKAEALQPVRAEISYLSGKLSTLLHDGIHRTCYSRIWHAAPSYLTNMRDGGVIYQQILTDNPQIYDEVRNLRHCICQSSSPASRCIRMTRIRCRSFTAWRHSSTNCSRKKSGLNPALIWSSKRQRPCM